MAEILVLDDVLDAVILVKKILTKQGHSVHTFTEEEEAIGFAGKKSYRSGHSRHQAQKDEWHSGTGTIKKSSTRQQKSSC